MAQKLDDIKILLDSVTDLVREYEVKPNVDTSTRIRTTLGVIKNSIVGVRAELRDADKAGY